MLTSYFYGEGNQLASEQTGSTSTSYSYDENGNLSSEQTGSLITTYTWDEENRLTKVEYSDGSVDTYVYFQDGRRWRAQSTLGAVTSTTLFIWDGLNLLLEEDAGLIARVQWTNFPEEAREVLVMREVGTTGLSNGESFFPGFDLSGNTRLMVGKAGISKWRGLYKSFGEERALIGYGGQVAQSTLGTGYGGQTSGLSIAQRYGGQVGSTFEAALNHLRFGGQVGYYTDRNGRMYVRARHYDSRTGRWLSPDPIGFGGGDWNLYRCVFNNPVSIIDALGLGPVEKYGGALIMDRYQGWTAFDISRAVRSAGTSGTYPFFTIGPKGSWPADAWQDISKSPARGRAYIEAMIGPFKGNIRLSAKRNRIPARLLASVILAELIDRNERDYADYLTSKRNTASVGPAQLQLTRAMQHNLVTVSEYDAFLAVYARGIEGLSAKATPGRLTFEVRPGSGYAQRRKNILDAGKEEVTYQRLFQPYFAVEAAAREISYLIDQITNNSNTAFGKWALLSSNRQKYLQNRRGRSEALLTSKYFNPHTILSRTGKVSYLEANPENALVKAVGATYNSPGIITGPLAGLDWTNANTQSDLAVSVAEFLRKNKLF